MRIKVGDLRKPGVVVAWGCYLTPRCQFVRLEHSLDDYDDNVAVDAVQLDKRQCRAVRHILVMEDYRPDTNRGPVLQAIRQLEV